MAAKQKSNPQSYVESIRKSGLGIYDPIVVGDPEIWIPTPELQTLLREGLRGLSLEGLPLRTRSKVVKQHVCQILGYPTPKTFKKTKPRFFGQMFDTYIQKSNNLQIWNEELSATRRYVIIRVSSDNAIADVKVVTGESLALLDTTGTLTQKYQARCIPRDEATELITDTDTERLSPFVTDGINLANIAPPVQHPTTGEILPIESVFRLLSNLVGRKFADAGSDQERNRGGILHRLVCQTLGYMSFCKNHIKPHRETFLLYSHEFAYPHS